MHPGGALIHSLSHNDLVVLAWPNNIVKLEPNQSLPVGRANLMRSWHANQACKPMVNLAMITSFTHALWSRQVILTSRTNVEVGKNIDFTNESWASHLANFTRIGWSRHSCQLCMHLVKSTILLTSHLHDEFNNLTNFTWRRSPSFNPDLVQPHIRVSNISRWPFNFATQLWSIYTTVKREPSSFQWITNTKGPILLLIEHNEPSYSTFYDYITLW